MSENGNCDNEDVVGERAVMGCLGFFCAFLILGIPSILLVCASGLAVAFVGPLVLVPSLAGLGIATFASFVFAVWCYRRTNR
jgi:uncharacterized membrane protein